MSSPSHKVCGLVVLFLYIMDNLLLSLPNFKGPASCCSTSRCWDALFKAVSSSGRGEYQAQGVEIIRLDLYLNKSTLTLGFQRSLKKVILELVVPTTDLATSLPRLRRNIWTMKPKHHVPTMWWRCCMVLLCVCVRVSFILMFTCMHLCSRYWDIFVCMPCTTETWSMLSLVPGLVCVHVCQGVNPRFHHTYIDEDCQKWVKSIWTAM